jgi:hypothetical protein
MLCSDHVCVDGCNRLYQPDDCAPGLWCKPVLEEMVRVDGTLRPSGKCSPSECNPRQGPWCGDGVACVAVTDHIGACIGYCQYGFTDQGYRDSCQDLFGVDHACQPLGQARAPVCIPAAQEAGPWAGCEPGAHPCSPGQACVDVVCRTLCAQSQAAPCGQGERCIEVSDRSDVSYCSAR